MANIDYTTLPDSANWDFTNPLCIEFFAKIDQDTTNDVTLMGQWNAGADNGWRFWRLGSSGATKFSFSTDGTNELTYTQGNLVVSNSWVHFAFQIDGSGECFWVGGVFLNDANPRVFFNSTQALEIGGYSGATQTFPGWIDSFRISNTSRYTWGVNFTPPSSVFTTDVNTLALFNFEEANGSTTTTDESSYARTMSFFNQAQVDDTQAKFGTASLGLNVRHNTFTARAPYIRKLKSTTKLKSLTF